MGTRPTREAYARGYANVGGFECTVGVEWQPGDNIARLSVEAAHVAEAAAQLLDHALASATAERAVLARWPDRAYFIETERAGAGVQVYQPFGMPRNA